jgi:hypothetical protein
MRFLLDMGISPITAAFLNHDLIGGPRVSRRIWSMADPHPFE